MMCRPSYLRLAFLFMALVAALPALAKDPVTLRFCVWDGDESLKVIRKILVGFEKENPDIHVKLENFSDYNVYHQKMLVQYAANVAPDVAMMDMGHFQALAKRGALMPLNPLIEKTPGFDIKEYYKPIVDAHSYKGTLYVLPRDIAPEGLIYYNKELFKEAGIPYPDGTWTWDFKERPELKEKDFLWVMHKLTKFGANGKPTQYGYVAGWPQEMTNTFFYSYGLELVDNPESPTKVLIDTPESRKVYNFVTDLMFEKKWTPSQTEISSVFQSTTQQLFAKKTVAMYQNGIWEVPNMRKMLKPNEPGFFDWDITLFPGYANGHRAAPTGGSGYAIFSSTAHPDEAWRLTRYMAGPPAMRAMAAAGIAQPAIRKIALSDAWLPGPNTPLEQKWPHNRLATDQAVPFVKFDPTADYWPDPSSLISARQDSIYNQSLKPEEALALAQKESQDRLNVLLREEKLPPFPWGLGIFVGFLIVLGILAYVYLPQRRWRMTKRERAENLTAYRFLTPWLFGLVVFTLGPMILSLLMSFMNWDMIRPAQFRGVQNYREAFTEDPRFWVSLKVTAIYTLVSTPVGILVALMLAMLLNQKVRGVPLFRAAFYIPSIASTVAASLIARRLFSPDGFLNFVLYHPLVQKVFHTGSLLNALTGTPAADQVNWLGNEKTALASLMLLSFWGVGGAMVVLLAGLQGIPQYYYEAATVDGASPWAKVKAITLPLLTPALFFSLITGIIGSFQVFTQVFVITNGTGQPNNATLVYMMTLFAAAFQNVRMGYGAALGWVLFLVILVFTLLQMKLSKYVYYEADAK